jgi:hypothetical protein
MRTRSLIARVIPGLLLDADTVITTDPTLDVDVPEDDHEGGGEER